MSHYYTDEVARTMDSRTIEILKTQDAERLFLSIRDRESELCGEAAVLTVLAYARLTGRSTYELLNYSNSSNSTGDKSSVVGYGAGVIWAGLRGEAPAPMVSGSLGSEQKKKLRAVARETVEAQVNGKRLPEAKADEAIFKQNRAVFVTLKSGDKLRGCIGRILPEEPLINAVQHMAADAATQLDTGIHYRVCGAMRFVCPSPLTQTA